MVTSNRQPMKISKILIQPYSTVIIKNIVHFVWLTRYYINFKHPPLFYF